MKTKTNTSVLEPPQPETSNPKPAAPAAGIKRISFGKAAVKKEDAKTAYPVFNDPATGNQVAEIAARIKGRAEQIEALEGSQKTDKAELRVFTSPFYFRANRGKHDAPSSISIPTTEGEVLITFQNRYTKITDESGIAAVIGAERAAAYFRQAFTLKIAGEELPDDKAQDIVNEISAVLEKHHCVGALEVDEQIKPIKDFHARRHLELTPEENMALEQAVPIIAMIKTKGRGAK